MNKKRLLPRIIASPFILCIILISFIYFAIKRWFQFLKYGGEFIEYEKNENTSIRDIYLHLKSKQ